MEKYITFIGSRKTPECFLKVGRKLAAEYYKKGFILRSGNARGFDQTISNMPAHAREIYLPYKYFGPQLDTEINVYIPSSFQNYSEAVKLVNKLHPNNRLTNQQLLYLARDVYQVLGKELKSPSVGVCCWTEDGAETLSEISVKTGGTGMALRVASEYGIPVYNIAKHIKKAP